MQTTQENSKNDQKVRVLFLAAEADPLIKVGGLGDVSGSLPRALNLLPPVETGFDMEVLLSLPFHPAIKTENLNISDPIPFSVDTISEPIPGRAYRNEVNGLQVMLIAGTPVPDDGPVYSMDTRADGEKFTFAALGALEAARVMGFVPDIVHANDWHTAMAVYAIALQRKWEPYYSKIKTILTVHNLPFIGVGTGPALEKFGLPPLKDAGLPWWAEQLPLPVGLATADQIVAVSPGYSEEILTPTYGGGLEGFLQSRRPVISGILNGIDTDIWDPLTDPLIKRRFSAETIKERPANKLALQESLSLPTDENIPLLTFIGRMDPQKGIDLVLQSLRSSKYLEWQAVILGTGDKFLEADVRQLEEEFPQRVRALLRFDGNLAHRLYAGADILLMPSRYEPCGLAQMIAMRYGCVPLARRTGGLRDTIKAFPEDSNSTGFLFDEASQEALSQALRSAILEFRHKEDWRELQIRGMQMDFSWHCSALAYAKLYKRIMEEA